MQRIQSQTGLEEATLVLGPPTGHGMRDIYRHSLMLYCAYSLSLYLMCFINNNNKKSAHFSSKRN